MKKALSTTKNLFLGFLIILSFSFISKNDIEKNQKIEVFCTSDYPVGFARGKFIAKNCGLSTIEKGAILEYVTGLDIYGPCWKQGFRSAFATYIGTCPNDGNDIKDLLDDQGQNDDGDEF